jgi:rhodanese-related sulfurtransferase/predicted transcriptional regulator
MGLEHRDDRDALGFGDADVLVDEVGVRVDDRELAVRLAAEQVGGARTVVVEQLSEEHGSLQVGRLDKLSSDLLNGNVAGDRRAKTALFEAIAVMGKAFASPVRLELLDLLAQGPRSVDELAQAGDQSTANASQHLQALHAAGLVTREREGTRVRYALAGEETLRVWLALREASAARLAEVERAAREYLGGEVEAIDRDELVARMARGDVVLVDVRPQEEYAAGHIEGSRSIPIDELERRLSELPRGREVVAYCRGPFCAYAHEAVRRLQAAGRKARRLDDGWPEWRLSDQTTGRHRAA